MGPNGYDVWALHGDAGPRGRTRGLDLHLRRLQEATREMFGVELHGELVRQHIRAALGDVTDASVRAYVFHTEDEPAVMMTVRPPAVAPPGPQRLRSVRYQRPLAHLKHLGGFRLGGADAQTYFRLQAERDGFDDALFTGPGGTVAEATTANIGFFDADTIVWPDAPALAGITMQILQREHDRAGIGWRSESVTLADIGSFDGAFLTNARGIWPVGAIDEVGYSVDERRMKPLTDAYGAAAWSEI